MSENKLKKWQKKSARYAKGEIDAQSFVNAMKNITLYYSTPVGDDKEGNQHLYVLASKETEYHYFPAFLSLPHCLEFFNAMGRNAFMIIQGTLKDALSSLDSSPLLAEFGLVIDPSYPNETGIPPSVRVR